ncbi:HECT-domain-containing protein [Neoconidiobolus thromboides FSU 785]|nr:HECT-domain-containing protein [Neoconidiobolus thromboides FSU 785]
MAEAGIDGGGVFKEFLEELMNQAFSIEMQLFSTTNDHLLYPNPSIFNRNSNRLKYYEFLGRMVGKALYEGILIEASFAKFFLSNWLNKKSYIDDLPSLDNELYSGLMILKKYTGDVEKDFGLNFTLIDKDSTGNRAIELIPNGEKIAVTSMNKIEYIYYVANYRLNKQIQKQSTAFLNGVNEILPLHWLKMFNEKELQMVISGTEQAIQISDFQENTVYSGVYDQNHPLIIAFWEIVKEMNHDTVARLLKFITSCQRPPLQGFKALNPPLCIRDSGRSDEWLPTASTCVNLLKLPIYSSKAILKK